MGLSIKNDEVERLAREIAAARKISLTRAIRDALRADAARRSAKRDRSARLKAVRKLQARAAKLAIRDRRSSKAISDDLWG
jgi:hypothetical protein